MPRDWTFARRAALAAAILYAAGFVLLVLLRPGGDALYRALCSAYQIPPTLIAAFCALACARRRDTERNERLAWLLITGYSLSSAVAVCLRGYFESIRHVTPASPSLVDAFALTAYPFLIAGVLLLFRGANVTGRARLLLDSAIAASSFGVLSWHYVVQPQWRLASLQPAAKLIATAYPALDIAALFAAIVLLVGATRGRLRRAPIFLLAAGIFFGAVSDTLFVFGNLHPAFRTGGWLDSGWAYAQILFALAALLTRWHGSTTEQVAHRPDAGDTRRRPVTVLVVLPYAAAIASFAGTAAHSYARAGFLDNATVLSGFGLMMLVVLRQVFTLLENQELNVRLRGLNNNLEELVGQRTTQLTALQSLTKAINTSLVAENVLQAALDHAMGTLQADAVAIWLGREDGTSDMPAGLPLHKGVEGKQAALHYFNTRPLSRHVQLRMLPLELQRVYAWPGSGMFASAPLKWRDTTLGMIGVLRWTRGFEPTDLEILESIGLEVATALENARLYEAAVEAADRDPVTGLFNHRAVQQRYDTAFLRAQESRTPLVAMMMDLNNFKLFNDTFGHPVGDQVLKRVAQALTEECHRSGIIGRYGGDEFVVILPNTSEEYAREFAQRLRIRMEREGFDRVGEKRTIPVALSIGIAVYPEDSTNRHDLLAIADTNLYAAKRSDEGIRLTSETRREKTGLYDISSFRVLDAMVTAVDNKDRYTRCHSEDVTEYALWIAEEMGLSEETVRLLRVAGMLHDVGKIGVPDEILRKPDRLTRAEMEVVKKHPAVGALIVGALPDMEAIVPAVKYHHERWDGKGYPSGLAGEEVPLLGRLLAVADAFSAMTTDRPYRKGMDWEEALEQIRENIGTQFDPTIATAFLAAAERRRRPLTSSLLIGMEDLPRAA